MTDEKIAGYLIAVQNWYALPGGEGPPSAGITSLDDDASIGGEGAQLYKKTYHILEVPNQNDYTNIGACTPTGELYYESLEDAQNALRERGVENPQFGFNPVD